MTTTLQVEYTVVEVALELKEKYPEGLVERTISTYLEDASELTDGFDQVTCVGENIHGSDGNKFYVNFYAPTWNLSENQRHVEEFLTTFIQELSLEELKDEWMSDLDSDVLPNITNYSIIDVRKYNW